MWRRNACNHIWIISEVTKVKNVRVTGEFDRTNYTECFTNALAWFQDRVPLGGKKLSIEIIRFIGHRYRIRLVYHWIKNKSFQLKFISKEHNNLVATLLQHMLEVPNVRLYACYQSLCYWMLSLRMSQFVSDTNGSFIYGPYWLGLCGYTLRFMQAHT
jgi:hypothetical protein